VKVLESGLVLCHPFVIGELACGHLRDRARVLDTLADMPAAPVATHIEALAFLNRHTLAGRGVGWVDVHLLASTALAGGARLWTRDKRLAALAADIGLGYPSEAH
jgi:predicted nucleic acid-binding protein